MIEMFMIYFYICLMFVVAVLITTGIGWLLLSMTGWFKNPKIKGKVKLVLCFVVGVLYWYLSYLFVR